MSRSIFNRNFVGINAKTAAEALEAIGGNFTVTKRDLFIANADNENEANAARAAGYAAVVREDTEDFLGVVSAKYGIVQYGAAVATTEELVTNGEANYKFGFVYNKGERLYLTMSDDGVADLGDGHQVRSCFTLTTSHDGTGAFEIAPTFVDDATGAILTFPGGKVWTKHSKNVDGKVTTLRHRLSKIKEFFTEFIETAKKLGVVKMTSIDAEEFLKDLIPGDSTRSANIRDKVMASFMAGPHVVYPQCNGTLLGLYLAFCDYADNAKTVRTSAKVDPSSATVRAVLDGEAARQKAEAYANAVDFARKIGAL